MYEGYIQKFPERELQMVQLSATSCSCITILWVNLASFASITLCVASQRVFIVVVVYFVIDSVRKLLDTSSYVCMCMYVCTFFMTHFFCFEKQQRGEGLNKWTLIGLFIQEWKHFITSDLIDNL
jgi:hypothetical protein